MNYDKKGNRFVPELHYNERKLDLLQNYITLTMKFDFTMAVVSFG